MDACVDAKGDRSRRAAASAATLLAVVLLLTAMSPWGTGALGPVTRFGYFLGCGLCWQAGLFAGRRLLRRIAPGWSGVRLIATIVLVGSVPGCAGIALLIRLLFGGFPPLLPLWLQTLGLGIGVAFAYRGVFLIPTATARLPAQVAAADATPGMMPRMMPGTPPGTTPAGQRPVSSIRPDASFLERHAPSLAGLRLLALEAEDHYLRIHAGGGSELVLLRLRDAIAELGTDAGWQPHRSFWIASDVRAHAERRGQGWRLALENGLVVPVSRGALPAMRAAGFGPQRVFDEPDSASAVGSTAE